MNLIEIVVDDGILLSKIYSTNGYIWIGKCPFCHQVDRFTIFEKNNLFRCNACSKNGNTIKYLQLKRGMKYLEARKYINSDMA